MLRKTRQMQKIKYCSFSLLRLDQEQKDLKVEDRLLKKCKEPVRREGGHKREGSMGVSITKAHYMQ